MAVLLLVLLPAVSLEALLLLLLSVSLGFCSFADARRLLLLLLLHLRPVVTRKTLHQWPRALRVQVLFLLRLRMLPIHQECPRISKVINRHTTLRWLLRTANLKVTSNLVTAATLLSPRDILSRVSASKANILLNMALEVTEFHLLHLLLDNSHLVPVPTRKAMRPHKLRSCLLFNHLEMRATVLSLARKLLIDVTGVKGVLIFWMSGIFEE